MARKSFTKRIVLIGLIILLIDKTFLLSDESVDVKEQPTVNQTNGVCDNSSKMSSVLIVGILSSCVFSFVGILPSFFIRSDIDVEKFKNSSVFKCLLAFAAGSLIADIFLHLIPETLSDSHAENIKSGFYSIIAFLVFLLIEKVTEMIPNAHALGTLNLIANFFDNSAHGTTVVGGFQVSLTFGTIALLATMIHEIPHEFGDFALLLRDGYTRQSAVKAQLITAFAGTFGATIAYALAMKNEECSTKTSVNMYLKENQAVHLEHLHNKNNHHSHHFESYNYHGKMILPFTIGGFMYIALVGIVPEIVAETDKRISTLQILSLICGIAFIYLLIEFENLMPSIFLN